MPTTEKEIDSFANFAKQRLENGKGTSSLMELLDEWRVTNSTVDDALAIQAAIRDMEDGDTGHAFSEFDAEFRKRHDIDSQ